MGLVLSVLSALTIGLVTIVCREWLFPLLRVRSALSNLDGPPVDNWWTGNWHQLFNKHGWAFKKHISDTYGTALKINAVGWDQQVYLTDPLAITSIFQTDRASYETARYHLLRSRLSFGWGLVGTSGEKHRKQRRLMAPFFSSNYLRTLMPLFYPFAYELADYMKAQAEKNGNILEMHSIISGAALEYVGAGLGYRFDVLNEARRGFYSDAARNINPLTFRLSTFRSFLPYMVKLGPPWFRKALIDWIPWRAAQELKAEIYKIDAVAQDILKTRRQAFADGEGYGRDILSAIMRWNDEADEDEKIDDFEIISHITTTLFAGHETTAGTLSRIFYQLAACPDAQERLREECTKARLEKGDLEFEDLLALPYLDAICKETLRVFPPVDQLYRTATKQTVLPLLFPVIGKDGKEVREIPIEAGTETISTIIGYNRNPHVWGEDAEEWIPDRWLEEPRESVLKAKLPAIFSHMMTFTLGERHCIGYKFAEMEMKLILTVLLPRFKIELDPNSEIYWNMGGSIAPVVKGSNSIEPTLPMKITPIPNPKV